MITEGVSTSRDSKRGHNGFPLIVNPGTSTEPEVLGAGPSNELPPPTYEEAVNSVEESSEIFTSSGSGPIRMPSPMLPTSGSAPRQEKHASQNPSGSAHTPQPSETNLGRHLSVASYYAPSVSTSTSTSTSASASSSKARASFASEPASHQDADTFSESPARPHLSSSTRTESFARAPPHHLPYGPFPPATLHAHSDDLQTDGFPKDPPTCACAPAPHPFVTHDVNAEDWASFLDDVRGAGGLTPVNGVIAGAAPIAVRAGFIGGFLVSQALRAHVKSKRKSPVADVIDEWNRKFFHPRSMDVVLAQGSITYVGPADAPPPDMAWRVNAAQREKGKGKHVKLLDHMSDDESEVHGMGTEVTDSMGRQLDSESRQRRRGRRCKASLSRDLRASAGERWRLIVSYNPPVL